MVKINVDFAYYFNLTLKSKFALKTIKKLQLLKL